MYEQIKKIILTLMFMNIIATQNVMADILFYYNATILPSIIYSHKTLDDFEDVTSHDPNFTSTHFSGSQNCAQCHDGISDVSNGDDVSIVNAWGGTMMANAAIDPLYLAKVASEVKRNPAYKDVIEDKCSRCHMPMANVEAGVINDQPATIFGDGFLNPENSYYNAAKGGVSCTLCHQIENDPKLGTDKGFSGGFVINTDNTENARTIYGPYDNLRQAQQMTNRVAYTPKYSSHIIDSKLCASCHNLNTPVIDAQGNLSHLTFPEQAVYTEWEYSDFNATKSCQECHMPRSEGSVVITSGGSTQRTPFRQHKFLGANTYMLEIIKNNRTKLGALEDETRFNESIADTRDFLQAAADISIATKSFSYSTLNFSVLVNNHSGHKFPTSLPSRRAWLHVKVTNSTGQTVFESGAFNSNKQIVGVDDTPGYEVHHQKIDDSTQVQVYEPIMADTDGQQTYTFMQASKYLKDNRILPKGYKNTTPVNAQPYGNAIHDTNFIGGRDTVEYEITNLPNDTYYIDVTLKYQTVSYGFAQDLYKDSELSAVALMKLLDDNTTNHFEIISTATESIIP